MSFAASPAAACAGTIGHPPRIAVGVFDSGFGGLTVLRALLPRLPGAHFIYLGDTARLPYGAKSQATVARYAVEAAHFLVAQGAQLLVIACNTATALALPAIRAAVPVPVIGVVEPGARAALAAAAAFDNQVSQQFKDRKIAEAPQAARGVLVLATDATVQAHAYRDTCTALGLPTTEMACPLLVPLVEEGWTDHPVTREVLRLYLADALAKASRPSTVLLGCTHYPLLAPAITQTLRDLGSPATVVDSAEAAAEAVRLALVNAGLSAAVAGPGASFACYATDSVEKFARLGSRFLGREIPRVELLDLGG